MLSKKGQEAAPFEMLVGVFLLGFVLVMGLLVLSNSSQEQCRQQAQTQLDTLKNQFENLFNNNSSAQISIQIPPCFEEETQLFISRDSNRTICSLFCTGANNRCTLLSFSSIDFTQTLCLRVPQQIQFRDKTDTYCENLSIVPDGFEGIDFTYYTADNPVGLDTGEYFFNRSTPNSQSVPEVCSFEQKQTP